MRGLLDASVLIALFDDDHAFNARATTWFIENRNAGWASCPLTQNAVLRILTTPGYSNISQYSLTEVRQLVSNNIRHTDHEFWPDDVSLLDDSMIRPEYVLGAKQLTDVYLLALAVKNDGRLVTFDERISVSAVNGANDEHLLII